MNTSKIIIFFIVQVFLLTTCNCYDNVDYSSVCEGEQMSLMLTFEHPFNGTIFAKGYYGNPKCSSPNMEVSRSSTVLLKLSFLDCNTTIKRVDGNHYAQATNTIIFQFHPLIESKRDFEITVNCNIDYLLSRSFFRSYLKRDLKPSNSFKSELSIMSGKDLFINEISDKFEVGKKQFIVLNVTDGGKHNELRIQKCYAHATRLIDQTTPPDVLLNDNRCSREPNFNSLYLKANDINSDLRDFSEIQNFEISFIQESFYITCAFDLCLKSCKYDCISKNEIKKSSWGFIQTNEVRLFDKSFKGPKNRNFDLKSTIKILSLRFLKMKETFNRQNTKISNRRVLLSLDESAHADNMNVLITSQQKRLALHDANKQIQIENDSRVYSAEVLKNMTELNKTREVKGSSYENFSDGVNFNLSKMEIPKRFIRRSVSKEGANYSDEIGINDSLAPQLKTTDIINRTSTDTVDSRKSKTINADEPIEISTFNANSFELKNTDPDLFNKTVSINTNAPNLKVANASDEISTMNADYSKLKNTDVKTFDKSITINADYPNFKTLNADLSDRISTTNINSHTLKAININKVDKSMTINSKFPKPFNTDAPVKNANINGNFSEFDNIFSDISDKINIANAFPSKFETPATDIADKIITMDSDFANFKTTEVDTSVKASIEDSLPKFEKADTYVSDEISYHNVDFFKNETADTNPPDSISNISADSPKLVIDDGLSDKSEKFMIGIECINKSCESGEDPPLSDTFSKLMNVTDCFNTSSGPSEENGAIDLSYKLMNGTDFYNISLKPEYTEGKTSENFIVNDVSTEDILKFDEMTSGSPTLNFTTNNKVTTTKESSKIQSVSFLKYAVVTSSLGLLVVSLSLIVFYLLCHVRKLKREQISFPKNVYNQDFQL